MAKNKKKTSDSSKQKKPAAKSQVDKKTQKKVIAKETDASPKAAPKAAAAKASASKTKAPLKAKNPKPKDQDEDPIDFEDFEGSDESLEGLDLDEIEEEDTEEVDEEIETDSDGDDAVIAEEASSDEVVLTDAEGNRYCRARDCDQIAVVEAYCRYHYLLFWRKIQVRKKILDDGKLERYVEELTSRYPDKFVEMIRRDLRTEKDFLGAIQELEIDESGLDNEDEDDTQSFVDEIRGMGGGDSEGVEEDF
ncbi:MAG: hypothetical protein KF789_05985 [Bdellovibrionaceae bacterium]|nr:hypothetical protein [Pseudobdellovibrionaceae bacterium]